MDAEALKEWYRYVDSVSRQPRRFRIDAEEERPWRPWLDEDENQPPNGIQGLTELPGLSIALAPSQLAEARVTASKSFEDPTLHDELPPVQEHSLPQFSTPSFDLRAPVFGRTTLRHLGAGAQSRQNCERRGWAQSSRPTLRAAAVRGGPSAISFTSGGLPRKVLRTIARIPSR